MAVLDEKECERNDIKKIIKASECMKHYKTIETVKKDKVVKTYEFAESIHTITNLEFVKNEEKSESVDSCDQPTGNVENFVKRLHADRLAMLPSVTVICLRILPSHLKFFSVIDSTYI